MASGKPTTTSKPAKKVIGQGDPPKNSIEVVVKATERCNINCTYCYVFNKTDQTYLEHPKYMSLETFRNLTQFLREGVAITNANSIRIDFHGGEPMMWKRARMREACNYIRETMPHEVAVEFAIQTNGLLVNDEWLKLFDEFQFSVGVSVDGPKEFNDRARIDHRGKGTYDRTIRGLKLLKTAWDEGLLRGLGVLCVASPDLNGRDAFRHFVDDLGMTNINFLLPIDHHDNFDAQTVDGYRDFFTQAYDAYIRHGDPYTTVRFFDSTATFFRQGRKMFTDGKEERESRYRLMTVSSNGDIGPDDSLRELDPRFFGEINVNRNSYREYLANPTQNELRRLQYTLAEDCQGCTWQYLCRGGAANGRMINRFSKSRGFNNASVICSALREIYSHIASSMISSGVPLATIESSLVDHDFEFPSFATPCEFSAATACSGDEPGQRSQA